MAELLLAASNLPSGYLQGDPIAVKPDGWSWSAAELLPPAQGGLFARVVITDVTVEQVLSRIEPLMEPAQPGDPEYDAPDVQDRFVRRHRRRWRVIVSELPASVRQTLNQEGVYTTTLSQVRNYVRKLRYERSTASVDVTADLEF